MNPKTDEELVGDIQRGNILAFEEIVRRYQRRLLRFTARIVVRHEQAQDVVQDTFFKLYQTIDRVDIDQKFSLYLFQIAKNTAISLLRAQNREISLETIAELWEDEDLVERLLQHDNAQKVHHAIAGLELKYQNVIRLYYFEELSYEEVAKKLKLPLNTVRTHLKRAKAELKTKLDYERS